MKTLEDRLTQAGDDLRHTADRMPPTQAPKPQPLRSVLAFVTGAGAVLLLVAVPAWLLSGSGSDDGVVVDTTVEGGARAGDVFMLPGFVPEGFTLSTGQMLDVDMTGTEDPSEAAGTVLQYLPEGSTSYQPGEPSLTIEVTDPLATFGAVLEGSEMECYDGNSERIASSEACREHLAGSVCVGEEAIEAGQLDAEACIAEERESVTEAYGADADVDFEETTVRGLPAQITRVTKPEPGFISVTTYEGGPVVSTVTSYLIDEQMLLQVAGSLRAVTPAALADATNGVAVDRPETFFEECMGSHGFEVSEVRIGRTLEGSQASVEDVESAGWDDALLSCETALYEEYGIPIYTTPDVPSEKELMDAAREIDADDIFTQDLREAIAPEESDQLFAVPVDDFEVLVRFRAGARPHIFATSCDVLARVDLPDGWNGTCLERTVDDDRVRGTFPYGTTSE